MKGYYLKDQVLARGKQCAVPISNQLDEEKRQSMHLWLEKQKKIYRVGVIGL